MHSSSDKDNAVSFIIALLITSVVVVAVGNGATVAVSLFS